MEYVEKSTLVRSRSTDIFGKIAKVTFILFLFFIIFGTKVPFKEKTNDVEEVGTSNIVNQIVFSSLFITASISLLTKRKEVVAILVKEKGMTLFLLWCLLSLGWSHFTITSFKRYFQIVTAFTVILSILVHTESIPSLLKYMRIIFSVYILVSIASVYTVPNATDNHGFWRGLATSKNHLGQASVSAAMVFLLSMKDVKWLGKIILIILMAISLVLLHGSSSSTSALTFIIVLGLWFLFFIDSLFKKLHIGKTVSITIIFASVLLAISAFMFAHDLVQDLFTDIGEDMTFTGRTELWSDMSSEIMKHPFLGTGYQGFWVLTNNSVLLLYNKYIWLPQQSHNGYLDIINETGFIGFTLFILMLFHYFFILRQSKKPEFWKWFIIAVLLINLQESTIFRPGIISGTFFMFSYLALFADLTKQKSHVPFDIKKENLLAAKNNV